MSESVNHLNNYKMTLWHDSQNVQEDYLAPINNRAILKAQNQTKRKKNKLIHLGLLSDLAPALVEIKLIQVTKFPLE